MLKKTDIDFIIISHSEVFDYSSYYKMPLDRIELFRPLVQLKMIYHFGGFVSQLDVLNKLTFGTFFHDANFEDKRKMLSVWNLPSFNGMLAINKLLEDDLNCKLINNFDSEIDFLIQYGKDMETPIIGVSTTFILRWQEVGRICKEIKKHLPNAIIIIGGAFVNDQYLQKKTDLFFKYLKKYQINYIIHSFNSESDLKELIKCIKTDSDPKKVNNLAYIDKNDEFITTNAVWNEPKLYIPKKSWSELYHPYMGETLQLRTVSGCPFSCAFCTYPTTAGKFKTSDVEGFREQLDEISKISEIKSIILIDDTPNVPLKRFRKLVDVLKEYDFKWYSFLRAQYMDDQLAKSMAESGCDGVYLGIESANDVVLDNMNKKARVKDYKDGIEMLNKYGITVFAAFVIGFPGEDEQTIQDNIDFIENTGLDFYSLKEFYYMHTAPIYKKKEEFGLDGFGNVWTHNSMSSVEAAKQKLRIFHSVKSTPCIDDDSGLWYLAYLRGQGFSWDEIKKIQQLMNEMMIQDNNDDFESKTDLIEELNSILMKSKYYKIKKETSGIECVN